MKGEEERYMVEHELQSGYIKCMDKPYIFTYDGELLQLVPKDEIGRAHV